MTDQTRMPEQTLSEFTAQLASASPAPGGGGAAALAGALAASLGAMAANVTAANPRYADRTGALSAMAANQMGTLRDASDRKRGFLTVSLPQIVRTDPADGNLKADPMGGITFYFKSPMNPGSFN